MLIFRQLFDQTSSTYTYVLGETAAGEALVIDPVFEQARRELALLAELELEPVAVVETHCHADHITGAWVLQQHTGAAIGVSATSGIQGADRLLRHGDKVPFGRRYVQVRETPGHTSGCLTYVLDDETMCFTGDTLLIRGCGRTDFQQGDARQLYRSVKSQIFTLPGHCRIYPGHDYRGNTASSVAEEKRHNPRLGGDIGEEDFVGYMDNLGLPHPKQIAIAVPANLECGRPDDGEVPDAGPKWAPLAYTFAGVWEIPPQWVEENLDKVHVLDVREREEFEGPLGHIPGASLLPIGALGEQAGSLDTDKPYVVVCRSGARSAQATEILRRLGIEDCANLAGGMLRWRAEGHPVQGGVA